MSTSNIAVTNSVEAQASGGETFAIETFVLTRRFGDLTAANKPPANDRENAWRRAARMR